MFKPWFFIIFNNMDSIEYKSKLFENNLANVMRIEHLETFFNKTYFDNDNMHELTLYVKPMMMFEVDTMEKIYTVVYQVYDQRDIIHSNSALWKSYTFSKKYTNDNFKADEDFSVIFNTWQDLKNTTNKDLFNKGHEIFKRKMQLDLDFV